MAKPRGVHFLVQLVTIISGYAISAVALCAAPPLSVYGKLPGFERAALSESGDHIALIGVINEERRLIVADKDDKPVLVVPLGDVKVRGVYWAGDNSVLVHKSDASDINHLDFTTSKAELFSMIVVPLNGQKSWSVFANRKETITGGVAHFYGIRERDGKYFGYFGGITFEGSLYTNKYLVRTDPVLYEVDMQNQDTKKIAPRFDGDGHRSWIIGPDGEVSGTLDYLPNSGSWTIRNRAREEIASGSNPLGRIGLAGLGTTPGTLLYREDNDDSEQHWIELPLAGGEARPVLKDIAVDRAIFDERNRQFLGYQHQGDRPAYTFFDAHQQKVIDGTLKAFPDLSVHLIDWNDRFDRLIVMTEGLGDPQTWWLVDIKTGQAKELGVSYPMHSKDVAPMRMIRYKAGDGMDIAAVLTLPPDLPAKNLPVIVLPHRGPAARDYPDFDWWAQSFASRGYAVLQPNFRGSEGYGAAFQRAGYGEWGRKMQSDISEGLEHLVKEGIADPRRACIVGANYGGYAALAGVTLQKGIYRCAVSVAGVSDVAKLAATRIDERNWDDTVRRALNHEIGSGKDLRTVSPINFAAAADAPILLIHGKDDTVVHYDQSVAMEKALRKADKEVEFVTLPGEDHWLSRSTTRLAMLEAAMAFVEKHNPSELPK